MIGYILLLFDMFEASVYIRFMAIAHRMECKDYIGVYSTGPWSELSKFRTQTSDLASILWTPSGAYLIVSDSHLSYKLLIYSTTGEVSEFIR